MELESVCVASDLRFPIFSLMSMRNRKATKNDKHPRTIALSIKSSGTWSIDAKTKPPVGENVFVEFMNKTENDRALACRTLVPTHQRQKTLDYQWTGKFSQHTSVLTLNRCIWMAKAGSDGKTIAESENVCHDNLNSLLTSIHTTIKNRWTTQTTNTQTCSCGRSFKTCTTCRWDNFNQI